MDRSVTRVLPLLLLLLSCQRKQAFSPQDLPDRESRAETAKLAFYLREQRAAAEALEATIRNRCQSNETVITLRRTPGYTTPGFDDSYDLAICGDGTVTYRGDGCQRLRGMQSARIDPAKVQKLVQEFLNVDYFGLEDYGHEGVDQPRMYTSLTLGKRRKMVVDYGEIAPQELRHLGAMIDEVAGSNRWVNIDAAGVHEKVREGWNIRSPETGLLLLKAAEAGDVDTVRAFIEERANVNARIDLVAWTYCRAARRITDPLQSVTPLQRAQGVEVVRLLIAAGANVNPKAAFEAPLRFQVEMGDADSVKALIEAGANMEAGSSPNDWTALMWAAHKPDPAVVAVLLRGGAKVNVKDDSGRTALDMVPFYSPADVNLVMEGMLRLPVEVERMQASAGEVERMLLSAGAVSGHPAD